MALSVVKFAKKKCLCSLIPDWLIGWPFNGLLFGYLFDVSALQEFHYFHH